MVNRNADRSKFYLDSPFSDEILAVTITPDVILPSLLLKYNGVGDPQLHILTFDVHTGMYESINAYELSNALKALMFATDFVGVKQ